MKNIPSLTLEHYQPCSPPIDDNAFLFFSVKNSATLRTVLSSVANLVSLPKVFNINSLESFKSRLIYLLKFYKNYFFSKICRVLSCVWIKTLSSLTWILLIPPFFGSNSYLQINSFFSKSRTPNFALSSPNVWVK